MAGDGHRSVQLECRIVNHPSYWVVMVILVGLLWFISWSDWRWGWGRNCHEKCLQFGRCSRHGILPPDRLSRGGQVFVDCRVKVPVRSKPPDPPRMSPKTRGNEEP